MRILVLEHGLLARDCAEVLRGLGHEADCVPLTRQEELRAGVDRADLLLSINLNASLARQASRRAVPYAAWVVDPRVNRSQLEDERRAASDLCRIFSYDPAQIPLYRELGYRNVEYLPTGAAPAFLQDGPEASPDFPVGFVGTPMVEVNNEFRPYREHLERLVAEGKDPGDRHRGMLEILSACLAAQEGVLDRFVVPEALDALERERGVSVVSPGWTHAKWEFVLTMSKEAAAAHRVGLCRALAPLGVRVWGPGDWRQALVPGMEYGGAAEYPEGAREAYRRTAVNLNVTRIYAGDVVANRVWDVLASGGFLLSDHRPELERHLAPGKDLVCYRTAGEAASLARRYLEHPEERKGIARQGRETVRARHTLAHRMKDLLAGLG